MTEIRIFCRLVNKIGPYFMSARVLLRAVALYSLDIPYVGALCISLNKSIGDTKITTDL